MLANSSLNRPGKTKVVFIVVMALLTASIFSTSCRRRSEAFVIALSDNIKTIDPIGSPTVDAASERVRVLMFNSLVKKIPKRVSRRVAPGPGLDAWRDWGSPGYRTRSGRPSPRRLGESSGRVAHALAPTVSAGC